MAMQHIEMVDAESGETVVHYDGPHPEFTLCGDAMEVDCCAAASEPVDTHRRVDCERCIAIVRYVRGR